MSCPVLASLASSVAAVRSLPVPAGLGADLVLHAQVADIAAASVRLQVDLALRMAALERAGSPVTDVRGDAVRAGLTHSQATLLRHVGLFSADRPDVIAAWTAGRVTTDQVNALRCGAVQLATPDLRDQLVAKVLRHLPGLSLRRTRSLVARVVDELQPGDPDLGELSDHAARCLDWAEVPRGGIAFQGYLPGAEAEAFKSAINALSEAMRTRDDGLSPTQRRADALACMVSIAARHGLPHGGGAPATLTMTVSVEEAARIAERDPAVHGNGYQPRPHGGSTIGDRNVGDATVRFGLCCAAITPVLTEPPEPGSLLHRIAGTPTMPLAVGRSVRLATPAQRKALHLRDGGCAIPGCGIGAAYTEPHHVTPWSIGGATDLENLVSLCWVHHRLTELGKFIFIRRRSGDTPPAGALSHPLYWIAPPAA